MADRVRELETTVSELQSTVKGLTEELVETKDRLRTVEEELGVDAAELTDEATVESTETHTSTDRSTPTNEDDPDEEFDDIIIA